MRKFDSYARNSSEGLAGPERLQTKSWKDSMTFTLTIYPSETVQKFESFWPKQLACGFPQEKEIDASLNAW